jgi:hypothetical protein
MLAQSADTVKKKLPLRLRMLVLLLDGMQALTQNMQCVVRLSYKCEMHFGTALLQTTSCTALRASERATKVLYNAY